MNRVAQIAAIARRYRVRSGGGVQVASATFVAADYAPPADGTTETPLTFTGLLADDAPAVGAPVQYALEGRFEVSASLSSVSVSPSSIPDDGLTIGVVTVILRDADSNLLVNCEVDEAVACALSGTGNTVTPQSTRTDADGALYFDCTSTVAEEKTITITAFGRVLATTPTLTVTGSVAPTRSDDFSGYADTAALRANSLGYYNLVESALEVAYANVDLDTSMGYDGRTQSMRINLLDATAEGGSGSSGRCTNSGHSAWLAIAFPANTLEVWAEIAMRFSPDYSCGGGAWGCSSSPEHKWMIAGVSGGTSRFNLECMNGQYVFGYPANETASVITSPRPDALFDGNWHLVRYHLKVGAANTGRARYWVDGVLRADLNNVTIDRTGITTLSLGQTRNQGAAQNIEMHFGKWDTWEGAANNPGW